MLSRSQLRHHSAVRLMRRNLRSDDIREHIEARTHDGRTRLITGAFDTEDSGVRHNWRGAISCQVNQTPVYLSIAASLMSDAKEHAAEIVRTLRERGHLAYFAGGCVRDLLLGREPADYDVATDATPRQVMQSFPQTYAVGEQFGVVLVPFTADTTEDTKEHEGDQPAL